ncbi:MAG: tetratricopeptide repeat protein [Acidobacteriota bacterium]
MLKRIAIFTILVLGACINAAAQSANDTVLVLPFQNTSDKAEFNWVGESFARSLSELLRVPNLNVVSNDQRKIVQQKLNIPLTNLPSLATSLKLAREVGSTLLITGSYNIIPAQADVAATINVTVKTIRVNEGRFISEELPDGRRITRDINLNDALGNLQSVQGQIAYQILYQRDKSLPFSQNQLIEAASKVPARAFEAYTKGLLSTAPEARENYFKNAVRLYAEATPGGTYSDAAIELAHLYLGQRKFSDAINYFEQVINSEQQCRDKAKTDNRPGQCNDEILAEASFYIGLVHLQQFNFERAMAVLRPLAEDMKLTSVYNALGAIEVQASRAEKKNPAKAAGLLADGVDLLKKAADSTPDDGNVRFNYGVALYLSGDMVSAAAQFRAAIVANPKDGEAYYILGKDLEGLKEPTAEDMTKQAQRFLTENNRYAKLETEWQKSKTINDIPLRVVQPSRKDFVAVILSRRQGTPVQPQLNETDTLLAQARSQVKNGQDDDAMATLRRVLASEPMSAESYLLLGKIHLRRGDLEQAISSFKTSVFWDNRLVDAHVSLGKIYVERGDCLQAKNYAASAAEIDPENQDVLALQRLSERCSK